MERERAIGLGMTFTVVCMSLVGLGLYIMRMTERTFFGNTILYGGIGLVLLSVGYFIVPALKSYLEEYMDSRSSESDGVVTEL